MNNIKLFFAVFLLFILEGTLFAGPLGDGSPYVVHVTLIALMFLGRYGKIEQALGFGLLFGLLYDFVYSDIIGIYLFALSAIPLFSSFVLKYVKENVLTIIVTFTFSAILFELDIYFFTASVVGVEVPFKELATQIIPRSLIAQLIGIIVLYYPMTRLVQSTFDEKRG